MSFDLDAMEIDTLPPEAIRSALRGAYAEVAALKAQLTAERALRVRVVGLLGRLQQADAGWCRGCGQLVCAADCDLAAVLRDAAALDEQQGGSDE